MARSAIRSLAPSALALCALVFGSASQAAPLFEDDFDTILTSLLGTTPNSAPPPGWTVFGGGSVDQIYGPTAGSNAWGIQCLAGSNGCIDLDGTTGGAGGAGRLVSSSGVNLLANQTYQLSVWLSGNQRPQLAPGSDVVWFGIAGSDGTSNLFSQSTLAIDPTAGFAEWVLTFTSNTAISGARIFIHNLGGDDQSGPILDRVSLSAVPLPPAAWLLLSGLAGFGAFARRRKTAVSAAAVLALVGVVSMGSGTAQAATVFADDFDSSSIPPSGGSGYVTAPPAGWTIEGSGTVDGLPAGEGYSYLCDANSACVDLDGTGPNGAGLLRTTASFLLTGGVTYELSALVSGNRRGAGPDDLKFGFLDTAFSPIAGAFSLLTIADNEPLTLRSLLFTPVANTAAYVFFFNPGGNDQNGPVLDNVSLTAVPLPAAAWLLLSGLGGLGLMRRRRPTAIN